jgi:hypothetical protein
MFSWLPSSNWPSLLVLVCASCLGWPLLATQRVTVEFATGPPPAATCPWIRIAVGPERYKVMTLATDEFIRRFLMHVLPAGFHRIRYYGMLTSSKRAKNVARARELLKPPPVIAIDAIKAASTKADESSTKAEQQTTKHNCPCCGGSMTIIERFARGTTPRHQPTAVIVAVRIDTS